MSLAPVCSLQDRVKIKILLLHQSKTISVSMDFKTFFFVGVACVADSELTRFAPRSRVTSPAIGAGGSANFSEQRDKTEHKSEC